jgi:hypothetical protein
LWKALGQKHGAHGMKRGPSRRSGAGGCGFGGKEPLEFVLLVPGRKHTVKGAGARGRGDFVRARKIAVLIRTHHTAWHGLSSRRRPVRCDSGCRLAAIAHRGVQNLKKKVFKKWRV